MNAPARLALFDLDGTLVDSAPDIADAVDEALISAGFSALGEAVVRGYIGGGAAQLIHRAITGTLAGMAETAVFERVYAHFLAAYEACLFRRTRVYPGVMATLDTLAANGWQLGVITNKPERFTMPLLEAANLARYFALVLGGDSLPLRKPAPEPLWHAIAKLGASRERAVMIGDSLADLDAARAAGVRVVCVDYGYAGDADLRAHAPDALIANMGELPAALGNLMRIAARDLDE